MTDVRIPSKAVSAGEDVGQPVMALLQDLNLLGTKDQMKDAEGFAAAFTGPPQSVALLEAGATAASKWWATGLGAAVIATWGNVFAWWGDLAPNLKITALGGAAFVTAALVAAIGYLLASDVRGRSEAAVATIEARARLADIMIRAASAAGGKALGPLERQIAPLPIPIPVRNHDADPGEEDGWLALDVELFPDGERKFLVVKGSSEAAVSASRLEFAPHNGRVEVQVG